MEKHLRILMVAPQFRPTLGGYERAAERLAEGLAGTGHIVEVVTERRCSSWPRVERSRGIVIRRIPTLFYRGVHSLTAGLSLTLFLLLRGHRFDLFHVHQYGWAAAITSAIGLLFGKPVFLKLTNTGYLGLDSALPRGPIGKILRPLHKRITCCIVTSQRAHGEAKQFGFSEDRIERIPNPMETERFRPAPKTARSKLRKEFGLQGRFTAICAARLAEEKDHATLIRAWSIFSRDQSPEDIQLLILGGGPLEEKIRKQASDSAGSSSIRMLGPVSDPLPWYQAADLYILSSKIEGLSNALIEALSAGLPVLSTCVSGSEDIFEAAKVGEIVKIEDPEAMADALSTLHKAPGRRVRCGTIAREFAKQQYSLAAVVRQMENCYARHSRN